MNINTKEYSNNNKQEEITNYKRDIERVKRNKNHLEVNFQAQYKELVRRSNELKHSLKDYKSEIDKLTQKVKADRDIIKELINNLHKINILNADHIIKTPISLKSMEEVVNPVVVINEIEMRETIAAKKIQSAWNKYKLYKVTIPDIMDIKEKSKNMATPPNVFRQTIEVIDII